MPTLTLQYALDLFGAGFVVGAFTFAGVIAYLAKEGKKHR